MIKIGITGASGFVGKHLINYFQANKDFHVVGLTHSENNVHGASLDIRRVDYSNQLQLESSLHGLDVVIHTAAIAHHFGKIDVRSYDKINAVLPETIAKASITCGVKRFIFISSVKAKDFENGVLEIQTYKKSLEKDAYSASKARAEFLLKELASRSEFELLILRPPLIYGQGVKANFDKLLKLASLRIPLPFGSANQKKSYLYIENFCSAIQFAIQSKQEWNGIAYEVTDDDDKSLREVLTLLRHAMKRKPFIFKIPTRYFHYFFSVLGKKHYYDKLFESECYSVTDFKKQFLWTPEISMKKALESMKLELI